MNKGLTLHQLAVDQTYEKSVTVQEEMIKLFAQATGDHNPIHLDEEYAKGTRFGTRVAHGMLQAGILSAILGMEFPGIGTIYLSQTLKFTRSVFIGDTIHFNLKVLEVIPEKNRVRLETVCSNQKGETTLVGEAVVLPPSQTD
ncbi:MAG: MaoC family dehydratase [Desulfobacteraceae bacterium]|nr:MAG: MaoC family dehydratase [Desulfobacteraceae bacterium]